MKLRVGILTGQQIEHERNARTFRLRNVRIGIGFHWDRYEDQEFEGELEIITNADGSKTAVNIIDIEDYLTSVISSEMSSNAPIELLKAHAVISRSWVRRAIGHTNHIGFDVCADDHCQRYEGLKRRNQRAIEAVRETAYQVLTYTDINQQTEICDCRYHKCCGGHTETYKTCWEDKEIAYLKGVDCPYCNEIQPVESLNDYDLETRDYHDWTIKYSEPDLRAIIERKSGMEFGEIKHLEPIKRGVSGRIYALRIQGSKRNEVIGKELKIRQWLSNSCLYSSWFDVIEKEIPTRNDTRIPHSDIKTEKEFILQGHGWGHGVGLCQIGAAIMAEKGYHYEEILQYYYPGTKLMTIE
ncbi:MAG: SpoIID/LytB domain-containing protein [Paludibacteraceae bacterium]|nr:SpoIID/LytB domain-containing protein [Paludibacteraceae bacterium]